MSTSMSDKNIGISCGEDKAFREPAGGRTARFESLAAESFMESLGLKTACEVVNPAFAEAPPPLALSRPLTHIVLDKSAEQAEEPGYDLVISRSFCNLSDPKSFPPPLLIKEELKRLITLSRHSVLIMYPAAAPFTLFSLAQNLATGFALEGFLPHRYPDTPHDRGETSTGDFYFFIKSHGAQALPAPFGITGGPSRLSPVRTEVSCPDEDPAQIVSRLRSCTSLGELAEALPFIYKLINLKPYDLRVRINLGLNLSLLGETVEGERVLKGVLCESPANHQARMALCRVYLSVSDWENLRAFLPELLFLQKADPRVRSRWNEIRTGLKSLEIEPRDAFVH